MFKSLINVMKHDIEEVKPSMAWPLMRWCSASEQNLSHCSLVNKYFFFLPAEMSLAFLSYGLGSAKVEKYPKPKKLDNKKVEALIPCLQRLYNCSKKDLLTSLTIVELLAENTDYIRELDQRIGMDKKELKVFGVKEKKLTPPKVKAEPKKEVHGYW